MKFGLAVIGNYEQDKSRLIVSLSEDLKLYFKDKCYGSDIKSYTIGVISVSPQFEQFFKKKKPRYAKGKKETVVEGIPYTVEDSFEYDFKLDFETFKNANEYESQTILAKEILKSLSVLDDIRGKIKNFDCVKFKSDLQYYFKEKGLI